MADSMMTPWGIPAGRDQISLEGTLGLGIQNRNWWSYVPPHVGYFWRRIVDTIGLETYQLMYETDETVAYAVEILTLSVLSRLGEYTHKRKRIEKFVRAAIEGCPNWRYTCAQILGAVPFGFSVSEILWQVDGSKITLAGVETLHPRSVLFILDTADASPTRNQLLEVWQWPFTGYQARLPLEKCVLYSHRAEWGNYWGKARLKAAFKNWFIKDQMLASWAKAQDRYGAPTTVAGITGAQTTVTRPDGTRLTQMQLMLEELERLRGSGTLVYENNEGKNKVELWEPPAQMGDSFHQIISTCDKKIMRAFLVPSLLADNDGAGSYALGKQHFDTFTLSLDFLLDELAGILTQQIARRIIELNFGKQDDYGTFTTRPFSEADRLMLSQVFVNAVNAGIATPENRADLDYMRDELGLPEAKDGDLLSLHPVTPSASSQPSSEDENSQPQTVPEAEMREEMLRQLL